MTTPDPASGRDPETGLLDQRAIAAHVETLTEDARWGHGAPFGVILLNLENALPMARNLGRDVYERAIASAAKILIDSCGADRVGRLAGEDFVIVVSEPTEVQWVDEANRVVDLLTDPIEVDSIPFSLDPAAGVAVSPEHGRDFGTLLAKAEMAMIEARRLGQPAALYERQNLAVLRRRLDLLTDLHRALRDPHRAGEIQMLYQPQVDIVTGRVVGFEALLRWNQPGWGTVNTQELISAIERTDVMHLLTIRVLHLVAEQLGEWKKAGTVARAAINVSVNDLHHLEFVDEIDVALRDRALNPEQLVVEITEGMVMSDPSRVARATEALADLGVGLSLDDFGTGYASLQQLRQLRLNEVKIDRSYVSEMTTNATQHAIVTCVHRLARALDLAVVAEGVEDAETVAALLELSGTIGQGWYFARPMSAEALTRWLAEHEVPDTGN